MAAKKTAKPKSRKVRREVDVYYPKSPQHQVVVADGAWAAVTTQLEIQIAFYKEIQPMPKRIRHQVNAQGGLGEIVEKDLDPGIVREAALTLVINPAVAAQLAQLLQALLAQVQPRMEASMKLMEKGLAESALTIEQQQVGVRR